MMIDNMSGSDAWDTNSIVTHKVFGNGRVKLDSGETVIVRFLSGIQECLKKDLTLAVSFVKRLEEDWDPLQPTILRIQSEAILSVHNTWGIYSPALMDILPHQLWVCNQVTAKWPTRWLVADDVGLGKTIEAGLILTALLGKHDIRRILIICPAQIVFQWQTRMLNMFGQRFVSYDGKHDTEEGNFWKINSRVIASLQTLKLDHKDRVKRLCEAEEWDLVIVDEAHHLNADEDSGNSLGYRLLREMQANSRIVSMIFFTGTPHRGKRYGFLSLLNLLRPDLFKQNTDLSEEAKHLSKVVIRNNKNTVTDMEGNRLFQAPSVTQHYYNYDENESRFYHLMTNYIASGRAYASTLNTSRGNAVNFVLSTMQKLASSSVATVRKALDNRLIGLRNNNPQLAVRSSVNRDIQALDDSGDEIIAEEENTPSHFQFLLLEGEVQALEELLAAARDVTSESRIKKLMEVIRSFPDRRNILIFTEYKASQALIVSTLMMKYGKDSVTIINGDEELPDVEYPDGSYQSFSIKRSVAADKFNSGECRFLISTEAGGEGIDLQENCYTLIHFDLPWNPMRMHQRVGRINRYGQKHQVDVHLLINPDTVESRIWSVLTSKLEEIASTVGQAMDDPEDLLNLVLGVLTPKQISDLHNQNLEDAQDSLQKWFNPEKSQLGGMDVMETMRSMMGNANRFHYQSNSNLLPRTDIIDLEPFFERFLAHQQIKNRANDGTWSFKAPPAWVKNYSVKNENVGLTFHRKSNVSADANHLLGVGHRVMDCAIKISRNLECSCSIVPSNLFTYPLIFFQIRDRITSSEASMIIMGVEVETDVLGAKIYKDWEIVKLINTFPIPKPSSHPFQVSPYQDSLPFETIIDNAKALLINSLSDMDLRMEIPEIEAFAILWPNDFRLNM